MKYIALLLSLTGCADFCRQSPVITRELDAIAPDAVELCLQAAGDDQDAKVACRAAHAGERLAVSITRLVAVTKCQEPPK